MSTRQIKNPGRPLCIVSGANSGIGFETALALAKRDEYRVILACRSKERGEAALKKMQAYPAVDSKHIELQLVDYGKLTSVREFAAWVLDQTSNKIGVLVNNAGISPYSDGYDQKSKTILTEDGYEQIFQVNWLSHFYLFSLLLPKLLSSQARVVNLSSVTHRLCTKFGWERHAKNGSIASYGATKFAHVLWAYEIQRRYSAQGLTAVAVNPGGVFSNIWSNTSYKKVVHFVLKMLLLDNEHGAATSVYAATHREIAQEGQFCYLSPYYVTRCCPTYSDVIGPYWGPTICDSAPKTYDKDLATSLWSYSMDLCEKGPLGGNTK